MRHDHESSQRLLGPRRPLSTPASLLGLDWLGVASGLPRGFADFGGIQRVVSGPAAQIFKSVASTNFAIGARCECTVNANRAPHPYTVPTLYAEGWKF
ncbi:MAG: hypothetical protein NVSMB10_18860 [Steroidobacteraceae bacterium]